MGIRGFVGPAGSHEFAVRMGGQLCVWEGVAPSLVDFSFVIIWHLAKVNRGEGSVFVQVSRPC